MAARKKKKVAKVVNMSGKRKTAIARATVRKGAGRVRINHKPIHIMEPELARRKALEPVQIAEAMNRLADVDVVVDVQGGGQMGQVDASEPQSLAAWSTTTVAPRESDRRTPRRVSAIRPQPTCQ